MRRTNTAQRSNSFEDQGKILLDQLIFGYVSVAPPRLSPLQTTPDSFESHNLGSAPAPILSYPTLPLPPFIPSQSQEQPSRSEVDQHHLPQIYIPTPNPVPQPIGPQKRQQRAEPPTPRLLSESPVPSYDAFLARTFGPSPTQSQVKKESAQVIIPAPRPDQAWSDPKRRTVEDLMDILTRRQTSIPQTTQAAPESPAASYLAYPGKGASRPEQFLMHGSTLPAPKRSVTSSRPPAPEPGPFQQAPPHQNPRGDNNPPLDQPAAEREREKESSPNPHSGNRDGRSDGRGSKQKSPRCVLSTLFFPVG